MIATILRNTIVTTHTPYETFSSQMPRIRKRTSKAYGVRTNWRLSWLLLKLEKNTRSFSTI
jgi:hypothetical protein